MEHKSLFRQFVHWGNVNYKRLRAVVIYPFSLFSYKYLVPVRQRRYVNKLKRKKKINVVFFAMNVPMWHYQRLYEALKSMPGFNVFIVLSPSRLYDVDQQQTDIKLLRKYFNAKNIDFIDNDPLEPNHYFDVKKHLSPDILFYCQPYEHSLNKMHDNTHFTSRLMCYYPYAFWLGNEKWGYNLPFHNTAWKLFYATKYNLLDAQRIAINKGRNVVVTGFPNTDDYLSVVPRDVWKSQNVKKKRVIIAPHCTINVSPQNKSTHGGFLWYGDYILDVAKKYNDKLQFVFKPHPRLKTELYNHPDWGKERTDKYYHAWETLENGQLEEGSYIDLFMTSDAMIHDCGSFIVEYLYSKNPVMYLCKEADKFKSIFNDFAKAALECHYMGTSTDDIDTFLDHVVLSGNDEMKERREKFFKDNLLPPNGKTVTQNTVDDLLNSLEL
jgi:hypothetical protein